MQNRQERQRAVRVATYAVAEELRVGLINGEQALARIREIHSDAGWPYDDNAPQRETPCKAE